VSFLGLSWVIWALSALVPFGTATYIFRFYRTHWRSRIVWIGAVASAIFQIALFLPSFAFVAHFAFLIIVLVLPFEYFFLDSAFQRRGLQRDLGGVGDRRR
jgi:hypothetical protein